NDDDGFIDMFREMTVVEKTQWAEAVVPLCNALVKTCHVSFKVINSPTILLPAWHKTVAGLPFENHTLPRDIAMRWNSTYDMLAAFIEMKDCVNKFLDSSSNGL
ncbi:hypothetical protein BT96DRAFT_737234, partial [Gymnopus androsaceus JB14]